MNSYKNNRYRAGAHKTDEGSAYSFWRIVRLLGLAATIIIVSTAVYFLFIGSINEDFVNNMIAGGMVVSIVFSVKVLEKKRLSDAGICFRAEDGLLFLSGVLIAVSWNVVFILVTPVLRGAIFIPQALDILGRSGYAIFRYSSIPLAEELFFRGYALNNAFSGLKAWQRSLLVSALFTIPYVIPEDGAWLSVDILVMGLNTFLFGLLLNYFVSVSKSIWLGFGLHWMYNFLFRTLFLDTAEYGYMIVMTMMMVLMTLFISWVFNANKGRARYGYGV